MGILKHFLWSCRRLRPEPVENATTGFKITEDKVSAQLITRSVDKSFIDRIKHFVIFANVNNA